VSRHPASSRERSSEVPRRKPVQMRLDVDAEALSITRLEGSPGAAAGYGAGIGILAGRVCSSKGRRRGSGGGRWVTWTTRGIAGRGPHLARRRRTHDRRHVGDHVEDAGPDEGV
jgi:hypothetical protein